MRRPLIVGVVLGAALAVMPLASQAATAPSVTLISPTNDDLVRGAVSIRWSYSGFYRTTPIDIEVSQGSGAFQRIARVPVDDGTPGLFGSATWTPTEDGNDYTVRIVMPTRPSANSSASPVRVDNTGPSSAVDAEPVTDPAPAVAILNVTGTATDAIAGVASVSVTVEGRAPIDATCAECGPGATSVEWSASAAGLTPGEYDVTAVATDTLGNVGEPSTATLLVVGTPPDPTPALLETVTGAAAAAKATVDGVIETVTGTTVVDDAVATVTGTTVVDDAVETATTTTEGLVEQATATTTAGEVVESVTTTTETGGE